MISKPLGLSMVKLYWKPTLFAILTLFLFYLSASLWKSTYLDI
jgi:hypothetical protein